VKEEQQAHFFLKGTKSSSSLEPWPFHQSMASLPPPVGVLHLFLYWPAPLASKSCYVNLKSKSSNIFHMGDRNTHRTRNLSWTTKNQITISIAGFQHLYCENRMNKQEIELHYSPCSICGTDILGFHHSTKSTEMSLQAAATQ
jgi:hypothetical protein